MQMSSNGLARLMIGVFGVLLIAFTVFDSPDAVWSLVPIVFIILALLLALRGRKLTWGPKSPKTQRIIYTTVFVVGAILAMLLPEVVGGEGISGSILAVTAIAAAVIGAISWHTYRPQGQESEDSGKKIP
ncbi:hypothetical protein QYM41_10520 [Kocuria sp. CPCC 205268]|uniref:hypothetical protein n=1 Tax=Kocuria oxytropis TaxID=3058913 RepID=UPI0034D4AABA